VGFSIDGKGYIGTGEDLNNVFNDFWEYDPSTDAWTEKANVGGTARWAAVGFSIGSKGYIGTGSGTHEDFWEYDPGIDTWTQKANFGGGGRYSATGFSIGSKGYMGTGVNNNSIFTMISGNMILPPIPGHRKLTLAERQELMQPDFP
jgi:N-acetylneuraminic acid mutarotase